MTVSCSPDESKYRLRLVPIAVTGLLAYFLPRVAAYAARFCGQVLHTPLPGDSLLGWLYVQHGFQLILALIAISLLKWTFVPVDFGLHWPAEKTYIWPAVAWGIVFGVVMTLVDHAPELAARTHPDLGFPLSLQNIGGWLFFEGVYVGPTEEIPFRSLLVTYLTATMPGKMCFRGFNMNTAGIIVALIFALLHLGSFNTRMWPEALGQQVYAFVLGVLYAYWFEKSKSIVAPILGHNISDATEYALLFAWAIIL
jgi:membrane protease YdiL (CAAX protease family)